jgi:chromosome partitioning protein
MKIISVVNMKGGVAKTTLAVNLADCLCRRLEKKVLLVDIDPQFNATQCLIEPNDYKKRLENNESSVLNIFESPRASASTVKGLKVIKPTQYKDVKPTQLTKNFHILMGNIQLYRIEMAPGEGMEQRLKRYLDTVKDLYDLAIIDTPPTPSVWMSTALIASNYYLVPCKPEPLSTTGIDLLKSVVEQKQENYDMDLKCAGLVLTIAEKYTKAYQEAVAFIEDDEFWKDYLFRYELPKKTKIAYMQGKQEKILDSRDATLKLSLVNITNELMERIDNE